MHFSPLAVTHHSALQNAIHIRTHAALEALERNRRL